MKNSAGFPLNQLGWFAIGSAREPPIAGPRIHPTDHYIDIINEMFIGEVFEPKILKTHNEGHDREGTRLQLFRR